MRLPTSLILLQVKGEIKWRFNEILLEYKEQGSNPESWVSTRLTGSMSLYIMGTSEIMASMSM